MRSTWHYISDDPFPIFSVREKVDTVNVSGAVDTIESSGDFCGKWRLVVGKEIQDNNLWRRFLIGEAGSHLLQRRPKPFRLQGRWWLHFLGGGCKNTVFIDSLQKNDIINGECYANFPRQWRKAIKTKLTKDILFHQKKATVQTHVRFFSGCCSWIWTSWSHYLFSWFNYHLSPNMKNIWLGASTSLMMASYLSLMNLYQKDEQSS